MESAAYYDEVDHTPVSIDERYSARQQAFETEANPCYGLQKTEIIDDHALKAVKQTTVIESSNTTKVNRVMIIMMMILLLTTIVSIVLSGITFHRLLLQQSRVLCQLENTNNDTKSAQVSQFDTIQMNLSHKVLELVMAQSNISQNLNQLDTELKISIQFLTQYLRLSEQVDCGSGLWHQLVYLNTSDPSQQCPSAWRKYNQSGACGRPTSSTGSCASVQYTSYQQYSRVCGRIIGYQFATPDAFEQVGSNCIDLDGINITHGATHNHIWSYVAGISQNPSSHSMSKCPCSDNRQVVGPPLSTIIGDRYYCESGNPNNDYENKLYSGDPLWDGEQCEGTCCTGTNSPPWFSVELPTPTMDTIEVSICCDQDTDDEDVPVKLIEIYVQ